MSLWEDFLDEVFGNPNQPGKVMICFVNRYLEGLDDVKYKIKYDGHEKSGVTTTQNYCIELSPASFKPIHIFVWSRKAKAWKKLDDVIAEQGRKKLVRKMMKTFKVPGKTAPLPDKTPNKRPDMPAPAPAPAPSPTDPQGITPDQINNENGQPQAKPRRPVPGEITMAQMKKIWPLKSVAISDRIQKVVNELNKNLSGYKLDTPLRRAHFFAQVREEAGPTFKFIEALDYPAERLIRTKAQSTSKKPASPFSYFLKAEHHAEAFLYGRTSTHPANQEAIANRVYAHKIGNGDISSGDGWRYRGRGLKQLTGRGNYLEFTKKYHELWDENVDFIINPELVGNDAKYAVRSAIWFWLRYELYKVADQGVTREQVDAITSVINKYTDSKANRWDHFNKLTLPAFK